jgi:hypothetical protein
MLDTNSRYIVASRTIDDRLAEVRRAHVLREARAGEDQHRVSTPATRGHSLLDRLVAAVGTLRVGDRTVRPAGAR